MPPDWKRLEGAYRVPYDPREAIARLKSAPLESGAWDELWDELHHQGDVGDASYAAVPLLVDACREGARDWNLYGLVATIEVAHHRPGNPNLPSWLGSDYEDALSEVARLALKDLGKATDPLVIRAAMSVVALARGERRLGAVLVWFDTSELVELVDAHAPWKIADEPSDA